MRSLDTRFLKLNEALIKLNERVYLAKWIPIRLAPPRIKLVQLRIKPNDTLHRAKWRLI
jgi:hypothetical protein